MTISHHGPKGSRTLLAFDLNDFFQTAVFLLVCIPALLLPPRYWSSLTGTIARLSVSLRRGRSREMKEKMERFFPGGVPGDLPVKELLKRITARFIEEMMIYVRLAGRPNWRPNMQIEGLQHLDTALAKGGIVLWSVNQISCVILVRVLLKEAGYHVHHVRNWAHGPSSTGYGRRVLNPLYWRVENRYASHIVVRREGPFRALCEISHALRDGGIVSFRGVENSDAPVTLPLFSGRAKIALGAPRSALCLNASLIAVRCSSVDAENWTFTLTPVSGNGDIEPMVEEFRKLCEQAILDSPDLWPVQFRQYVT